MKEKIIVAADPMGACLKNEVRRHLEKRGFEVVDVGTTEQGDVPYWEAGSRVGLAISQEHYSRGIVFCGSGMGVSIVANKFPGVYCGVVESLVSASLCRMINNCNVLALGQRLVAPYVALKMVDTFLEDAFTSSESGLDPAFLGKAYEEVKTIEKKLFRKP